MSQENKAVASIRETIKSCGHASAYESPDAFAMPGGLRPRFGTRARLEKIIAEAIEAGIPVERFLDKDGCRWVWFGAPVPAWAETRGWPEDEPITPVLFRIPRSKRMAEIDGVTAIFPAEPGTLDDLEDLATCYAHVGQHGSCSLRVVMNGKTRTATPEEYADLKAELEAQPYGYRLKVYERVTPQHNRARRAERKRLKAHGNA